VVVIKSGVQDQLLSYIY